MLPSWCPNFSGTSACGLSITGLWNSPIDTYLFFKALLKEDGEESSVPITRRPWVSAPKVEHDQCFRVQGSLVDKVAEVIEEAALLGLWDYLLNFGNRGFSESKPTHSANVNWHLRSRNLARRIHYGWNVEADVVPPEYLMALLCDTRVSADALIAYNDAWSVLIDSEEMSLDKLESPQGERRELF